MIPYAVILIVGTLVGIILAYVLTQIVAAVSRETSIFPFKLVCVSCGAPAQLKSRIPIIGALGEAGICSNCAHKASLLRPVSELFVILFTIWTFIALEPLVAIQLSLLFMGLVGVALMDVTKWIIPNAFVLVILAAAILALFSGTVDPTQSFFGMGVAMAISLLIILPQKFGKGDGIIALGDVKLVLVVALYLGWILSVYVFFLASFLAFLTWIISGFSKGFSIKRKLQFGPFVALSTMIFGIGKSLDPQFVTHLLTFRF